MIARKEEPISRAAFCSMAVCKSESHRLLVLGLPFGYTENTDATSEQKRTVSELIEILKGFWERIAIRISHTLNIFFS